MEEEARLIDDMRGAHRLSPIITLVARWKVQTQHKAAGEWKRQRGSAA